jgi:hypothetical protein
MAIGLALLAVAGAVGYLMFNAVLQLWEAPMEIPMVRFLVAEVTKPDGDVRLPGSYGLMAGIFFAVLIVYCATLVLRALITGACHVLVPDVRPWAKRMTTELARLRAQQDQRPGP